MFGRKKKKDVEVVGKQEGERQKNINEPKYKIIVYKNLGRDVYQEIDNTIEENKKLKQLKVLKYVINHSDEGSYDSIDGQGFRQRFYLYDEGALVPMFWDRKTASLYVAVDTAIKFYKADQDLINQDYADENRDKWAKLGKGLMVVIFTILFLGNMYMFMQNLDRSNELDARSTAMAMAIEESGFGQCIGIIAERNEELGEIVKQYNDEFAKNSENNINVVNTDLS